VIYPTFLLKRHEYDYEATLRIMATDISTPWMRLEITMHLHLIDSHMQYNPMIENTENKYVFIYVIENGSL
jgi:hypothetical protein